jgi:hypothetical protein
MERLDDLIAGWLGRGSVAVTLVAAVLLGLRHATDPDHLVAVTTLIASDRPGRFRRALRLGLSWGLGHGLSLLAFGSAAVLLAARLPGAGEAAIEALIGVIVIVLALRLLIRARRAGRVEHRHGLPRHPHPVRSRREAFAVGIVHGAGGSAGVTVLLLANIADVGLALTVLVLFAAATAVSMSLASLGFARALGARPITGRLQRLLPAMGIAGMAFGAFYVATAIGV